MKTFKKTPNSPFLKLNQNILMNPEFSYLNSGRDNATRIGVFLVLALYLASCEDCLATYVSLRWLAYSCNKKQSYLLDMIHHSGLFLYDDEKRIFQCKYICDSMNLTPIVAASPKKSVGPHVADKPKSVAQPDDTAAKNGADDCSNKASEKSQCVSESSSPIADNCSPIADSCSPISDNSATISDDCSTTGQNTCANIIYGRTCGREDTDKDKDIDKNKYPTFTTSNKEKFDDVDGGGNFPFEESVFKDNDCAKSDAAPDYSWRYIPPKNAMVVILSRRFMSCFRAIHAEFNDWMDRVLPLDALRFTVGCIAFSG